ncbi:hypothetical protein C8J57DRAFT_1254140 [Mycena rebaudengoi]|nr:hypothetical protein C8J57DRAFT_1254140 [Mycena rebaudengoi]
MGDQIYFSGDKRAPGELGAVDFVRRLEIQFRANNVVADTDKIMEASLCFKADSPVDAWWAEIQADAMHRAQVATWQMFLTAFNDRFKGVQSVSKPLGQRLTDLEHMRMDMDGLAVGMVLVGDKIMPMADFIDHLKDTIKEAGMGPGISGLWQFYEGRIDNAVHVHVKEKVVTEVVVAAEHAHQQHTAAAEHCVEDLQRKLAAIESFTPPPPPLHRMRAPQQLPHRTAPPIASGLAQTCRRHAC